MIPPGWDTLRTWLAEELDRVPERLLDGLSGGVHLRPEEREDPDLPGIWILGEYIEEEGIGPLIALYAGSLRRVLEGEDEAVWREELRETLWHELRHHWEVAAGLRDLDEEDERQWLAWYEEARRGERGRGDREGEGG